MVAEIDRNIHRIAIVRYPWPRNVPEKWPCLVRSLEGYKPCIVLRVIYWKAPNAGFYKSNTNGASKGNPGPSVGGFYFRDWKGDFIFVASHFLGVKTILEAEAMALQKGLLYYLENQLIPVSMEIDSHILSKIFEGSWDVPWCICPLITKIRWLMRNEHVEVKHVLTEGGPKRGESTANFRCTSSF
ncbi:hypothetical protein KY285_005143 [Solanum tuberosum]|nr:hypothetical protein KY284_005367 [Solanum tuberosum]KAH0751995.1 hypothetical protein KY285_005143 [Solanum tuberosum]